MLTLVALGSIVLSCGAAPLSYCARPEFRDVGQPFSHAKLEQVIMVMRHGDRTPSAPLAPYTDTANFTCDSHLQGLAGNTLSLQVNSMLEPLNGSCALGQLTPRGVRMWQNYAPALREYFINNGIIPPPSAQASESLDEILSLYSSPVPRTVESLSALLSGLFPNEENPAPRASGTRFPTVSTADPLSSPLTFPFYCPPSYDTRLGELLKSNITTRDWYINTSNRLMWSFAKGLHIDPKTAMRVVMATADAIGAMVCHGFELPPFLDNTTVAEVIAWDTQRISMGLLLPQMKSWFAAPLLDDIVGEMYGASAVEGVRGPARSASTRSGAPPKLALFSGHDVTVLQLVTALTGAPSGVWPSYGSSVRIEVFKDAGPGAANRTAEVGVSGPPLWVRAIYQESPLPMPCGPEGTTSPLCQLTNFLNMLRPFRETREGVCNTGRSEDVWMDRGRWAV